MAPNQRSADKRCFCIYVRKETYERFQAACEFFGLTMTVVVSSFMEQKAKDYEKSLRKGTARHESVEGAGGDD